MSHFDNKLQSHLNWIMIEFVAVISQGILNMEIDFATNNAAQDCEKTISVSV